MDKLTTVTTTTKITFTRKKQPEGYKIKQYKFSERENIKDVSSMVIINFT